jgi:hypothetical protein
LFFPKKAAVLYVYKILYISCQFRVIDKMALLSIITAFILCFMAENPPKCPSSGQGLECGAGVNVNDSARVNCAGKTRRKFLALGGAALVATVLGVPGTAEAKSRFSAGSHNTDLPELVIKKPAPFTWKQLVTMDSSELEEKLSEMDASEVQRTLQSLLPVVDEINQIADDDIDEKLKNKQQLDESEKEFFLKLAKKYRPQSLLIIQRMFEKQQLTDNNFQYLFIEFRHFVKNEYDIVIVLNVLRSLAVKREYIEANEAGDEKYRELQKNLKKFIQTDLKEFKSSHN